VTTVAFDGRTLAADRRMTGACGIETAGKIFRLKDGRLLAGAGTYDDIVEIVNWLDNGGNRKTRPTLSQGDEASDVLLIDAGTAYWLTWPHLRPVKVNAPFIAIGSGGPYALGAMAAGRTAAEAVAIAARFDNQTGNGIDAVESRE
jgi:hypothetical protein